MNNCDKLFIESCRLLFAYCKPRNPRSYRRGYERTRGGAYLTAYSPDEARKGKQRSNTLQPCRLYLVRCARWPGGDGRKLPNLWRVKTNP